MNHEELSERLRALERTNRRTKRALCAAVVVLGAVPLLGFARDEPADARYRIVYASKFALEDPQTGRVRAELAHQTSDGGWAGITLWDDGGAPRAELKFWEDGRTHLLMMDADRRELSRLSVGPDGEPTLVLGGKVVHAD